MQRSLQRITEISSQFLSPNLRRFVARRGQEFLSDGKTDQLEDFLRVSERQAPIQNQYYKERGVLDDRM